MTHTVLFATSEVFPLAKTGGLADVSASLPRALSELGHRIHVLMPGYAQAMDKAQAQGMEVRAKLNVAGQALTLWETRLPGSSVMLWLVDAPSLFSRPGGPYQDTEGNDWADNAERFHFFCEVACLLAMDRAGLNWRPDIVHCNDWQTGLVPALLDSEPQRPATVFTLHNLAYQGLFPYETFQKLDLPSHLWRFEGLEFHGQLSFIKGGLAYADRLTTVSPSYAREIQTQAFGHGLDGLLRYRQAVLGGILNGIDQQAWDPEQDPHLDTHYGSTTIESKAQCKRDLQHSQQLDAELHKPLLGFIGRLADQKGVDLLIELLPRLMETGCQVVILGAGDPELEATLRQQAERNPGRLAVTLGLDEGLAHRITAGADVFLMPSRFEPCGLNQMYSLRYGTVPVVHSVGGLQDTVLDLTDVGPEQANGFRFTSPIASAFWDAISRCLEAYQKPDIWKALQQNGMARNFSWQASAQGYSEVYRLALEDGRAAT